MPYPTIRHPGVKWSLPCPTHAACCFYYCAGANTRPDPRWRVMWLVLLHAVLLELSPLPGEIHPYTLITIALYRLILRLFCTPPPEPAAGRALWSLWAPAAWSPLTHAAIAALLVANEDVLGYAGLQLSYGARGVMWTAAGRLRSHSQRSGDVPCCAALPYEIAAVVLGLHHTYQNCVGAVCRSNLESPGMCTALKATVFPCIVLQAALLHSYRYRSLIVLAPRPSTRPHLVQWVAAGLWSLAHHSLIVYAVHMFAVIVYSYTTPAPTLSAVATT
jgi:hypothetical protein